MQSENLTHTPMLGATVNGSSTDFRLWAPAAKSVMVKMADVKIEDVKIEDGRELPMQPEQGGMFFAQAPVGSGERYWYILKGDSNSHSKPLPDPVSRLLPEGVHGPTEIVDPTAFCWSPEESQWHGLDFRDAIIYELHVGTFTGPGTFDGVAERLDYLKRLGVTAIELMPVAAFPGTRTWGDDGVSPYAVQASYGGPDGLKRLVDQAHCVGLGVVMDVVYNHLGPEGNYLSQFGPYFTDKHQTPWGAAINYDQPGSEHVRRYFIENALYWVREYHVDGLRLDAIQTIRDESSQHIVSAVRDHVKALADTLGRTVWVIGETDENDAKMVHPKTQGGWELDAVWSDDFHHAMHAVLTGENKGYYQDFGHKQQIVRALNEGFAYQGEHFAFWGRTRGTSSAGVPVQAHVVCIQNHDQVGNRALGERFTELVPIGARKLAAALLLLAPETPLLFMGEEYGEQAPFQFFSDFGDPALQKAVSEGRRNEFKNFDWNEIPDPQDPATFERSKLRGIASPEQEQMLDWYRKLIELRKRFVSHSDRTAWAELTEEGAIRMPVPDDESGLLVIAEFPDRRGNAQLPAPDDEWRLLLESDQDNYTVRVYQSIVSDRDQYS
jgi:maltooligosyltrehalose trehalohydrolase